MSDLKRPGSSSSLKKQITTTTTTATREGSAKLEQKRPESAKKANSGNESQVPAKAKSGAANSDVNETDNKELSKANKSEKANELAVQKTKSKSALSKMYELSDDEDVVTNTSKYNNNNNNNNSNGHNTDSVEKQQISSEITPKSEDVFRPNSSSHNDKPERVGSAKKQSNDKDVVNVSNHISPATAAGSTNDNVDSKGNVIQAKLHTLPDSNKVKSWAQKVGNFSSQFRDVGWHATQILGAPTIYPSYGDITGAWAQALIDSKQFIELIFPESLYVEQVNIYETYNAGAVVKVLALAPNRQWVTLWKTDKPCMLEHSRIFSPSIEKTNFPTSTIRLNVDCTASKSWCEIDAVELVGTRCPVDLPKKTLLSEAYLELVNNAAYSDVKFKVDGQTIFAHKAILATRSRHFKALIEKNPTDKVIAISQISTAAFVAVLQFVYTGSISCQSSPLLLLELIQKSALFELQELVDFATYILLLNLNKDNVLSIINEICLKYPTFTDIQNNCVNVIAYNLASLTHQAEYATLSRDLMISILQRSEDLKSKLA